jgi:NTE family protein
MPGFREVPIHEAVVASCALPGIFPPKKILGYQFVDGSVTDTLPIKIAIYNKAEIIIGVYLESLEPVRQEKPSRGIAEVLMGAQTINSRTLIKHNLRHFKDAPTVLIHPSVSHHAMFSFGELDKLIDEGERAAREVLTNHELLPEIRKSHPQPPEKGE